MSWLLFCFLPGLAGASLVLARLIQRGGHIEPHRFGALRWCGAVALSVFAVTRPDPNRFAVWRSLVRDAPVAAQALAGLALALAPGVLIADAFVANGRSRRAIGLLAAASALWAVVYPQLPMHLSAPDFDDFFVVGKFVGATLPTWFNDKPFFAVWDYAYRALEPLARSGVLERFRINGWYALLYVVATGLWVERCLAALPDAIAPRVRRWVPWIATLHLGPVVLSHTLAYELPCAATILALSLLLERLRTSARAVDPLAIVAVLATARVLQAGGHNASAMAWLPVQAQGLLALRARGHGGGVLAWGAAIAASAAVDIGHRGFGALHGTARLFDRGRFEFVLRNGWAPLGVLVVMAAFHHRRAEGAGALGRWVADAWRAPRMTHTAACFLAAGAAIYLSANQDNLGLPIPGRWNMEQGRPWNFGTNHARYALFFYPALAALLAGAALPLRHIALPLLAAFPLCWNLAYVTHFYRSPPGFPLEEASYHRNTRYLAAARLRLAQRPREVTFLPIPRDHGDNFLARVAQPGLTVTPLCPTDRSTSDAPLLLSAHTLAVLDQERAPPELVRITTEDVALSPRDVVAAAPLAAWCARPALRPKAPEDITP